MVRWYTAYLRETEEVLASGTATQVAGALGLTMGSFYCAVSRSKSGDNRKYEFEIEDPEDGDLE